MEPWLDSLSEDWNSESHLSSPTSSLSSTKRFGSHTSKTSHSRIPHLSQSLRGDSASTFLKPRSSRGIAKVSGGSVLSERSASSLNVVSSPRSEFSKSQASNIPRRVSSAFSESQSSVQRHSVRISSDAHETPDWKRRLIGADDVASDGVDLFSPSKLEGIFAEPAIKRVEPPSQFGQPKGNARPWGSLKLGQLPSKTEQYQSLRASRSRAPTMEALYEVNEEEQEQEQEDELNAPDGLQEGEISAISSDFVREVSITGLVQRQHVASAQPPKRVVSRQRIGSGSKDPRWRTISGQQEIMNELISPVTVSAKNTIRERAVKQTVDLDSDLLKQRLMASGETRPSSRSSDRDISYMNSPPEQDAVREMPPELTSHSLPEDLSMGTQDFMSNGSYLNHRRGGHATEASFTKNYAKSAAHSGFSEHDETQYLRSSPPPRQLGQNQIEVDSDASVLLPELLSGTSVIRHSPSPARPSSTGSPLKLFGNRDTYTNNKLLRILNHYRQDDSTQDVISQKQEMEESNTQLENELRMSRFGNGELDRFHFDQEVKRPRATSLPSVTKSTKIFGQIDKHHKSGKNRVTSLQKDVHSGQDDNIKRLPSSPAKDRTPKRRRTLLKDEVFVQGVGVEIKLEQLPDAASAVAGKKRKDARPGENGGPADANTLATRNIIRPKSGSRKSSLNDQSAVVNHDKELADKTPPAALTEALAAELASFAKGVSEAHHDSRKPSLATRDYMEEANKVMEFIRARGRPRAKPSSIMESNEVSELGSDDILDLEIDDDSTKESFSRPPSRDRPVRPREDRRIAKHDPSIASQLRKYKESDEIDLLTSTSVIGTFGTVHHQAVSEVANSPAIDDRQESSPQNIRILNIREAGSREREDHNSGNLVDHHSTFGSTKRTFATNSSGSSGQKGVISSGTVSIPNNVGTMMFDREKQLWVEQKLAEQFASRSGIDPKLQYARETTMSEDPFHGIPDLSIDEEREAALRTASKSSSVTPDHLTVPEDLSKTRPVGKESEAEPSKLTGNDQRSLIISQNTNEVETRTDENSYQTQIGDLSNGNHALDVSKRNEISQHEERLRKGLPSKEPSPAESSKKQPRAVTIAFSSPVVSQVLYAKEANVSNIDLDNDDDFLPPDDSDYEDYVPTPPQPAQVRNTSRPGTSLPALSYAAPRTSLETSTLVRRPVSPIIELDEDNVAGEGLSLVHIKQGSVVATPSTRSEHNDLRNGSAYKGSSILCLTPLSEFTMHQADQPKHTDESFIVARPHPKALLQAHGALALSKDEMIKAITDASPDEPFWERMRRLDLADSRLGSLNSLQEYCPALEELVLRGNNISQLTGLPPSLRRIDAGLNLINDFTSWLHLQNLQVIDVSNNRLESLEAFGSLIHLRDLTASNNNISSINGVFGLDGLISLNLSGNSVSEVDFKHGDLSQLRNLDLSNNKLTCVQNLQALPRLEQLNLGTNGIREISAKPMMQNATHICLAHNELEVLDLGSFPNIEDLDIDDNSILSLQGLSGASQLRKLSARGQKHSFDLVNSILSTPNECSELYLSSNLLEGGQIVLPEFPHYNLRLLELAGCGLRAIPKGFGDFFPNCRNLNFNYNAISDLSQMIGCIKLREVLLAGNRIQRLRRTCLAVARLPFLTRLDIRDNPLTVGFYSPDQLMVENKQVYTIPDRCPEADVKWMRILDEVTALKRQTLELLLMEKCKNLNWFDGCRFQRDQIYKFDDMWSNLMSKGVLAKPMATIIEAIQIPELPRACGKEHESLRTADRTMTEEAGDDLLLRERSLVIE